ncbi:MAG TPA: two-component regulator propeller domain-containing protein [candidate division Zixibacteria bacterium]|nr:two-component regulator propeller domain-containing protein [candidate division Zixibacteria bacterium]
MRKHNFLKPIIPLLALLFFITSSKAQSVSKVDNSTLTDHNSTIAIGDTVIELGNNIMVIYQDKKNNYWFGSWVDGVYWYDGKTTLHFTTKDGLSHDRIDEIQEDKLGNIYFRTSGGINKFDGQKFTTLSIANNSNNEWKLEPNDLWFKSSQDSGLVYRYDGVVLHRLTFPNTKLIDEYNASHPRSNQSFPFKPYDVYSIYKDSKGNIWFGTAVLGVCRYNGRTVDWISEDDVTELHNGPANGVRAIIEDKDGFFWFNSMYRYNVYGNDSLSKSNSQKQTFYSREKGIGSLDGKKDSDLWEYLSIAKDNNNELWIATYRDGVWHYDGKNISHYSVKDGSKDITLFYIYKDNNGNLWLGTHEAGAYKFNGKTFEKFRP